MKNWRRRENNSRNFTRGQFEGLELLWIFYIIFKLELVTLLDKFHACYRTKLDLNLYQD